jgi:putative membrane protein insertion efficiency factor
MKYLLLSLMVGVFTAQPGKTPRYDSMRSPFEQNVVSAPKEGRETSFLKLPGFWSIRVYQQFISPINGRYCQMYPSCSRYANAAIQKYGAVKGVLMAADRIHRCGHDLKFYDKIYTEKRILFLDPVR